MGDYLANPVIFLVRTAFQIYILLVLLRFFLQAVRADFYNPLSQLVVKATAPLLTPLRRVIPPLRGLDTASLVLAWGLKTLELVLVALLRGGGLQIVLPLLLAIPELVSLAFDILFWAILIQAILSWIQPGTYSPITAVLDALTAPLLRPARRLLPPMGGLDFSPMIVMVVLVVAKMLVVPPLQALAYALGS